jgi:prepilin-type N-terminal cleavage/methylation domain-containing protein
MTSQNHRLNKGFTLLEMTVVLAIVAIMTSIILMNLPQMKGGLSIDVVSQEVAIYIRGAQVYSRATKVIANREKEYSSFGMHFTNSQNDTFFLWADGNGSINRKPIDSRIFYWEDEETDPKQEIYELPKGFVINKLLCGSQVVDNLDIVFQLPDPEADFASTFSGNQCPIATLAKICLRSANSEQYRIIETYNNGQIAVAKDPDNICK